MNPNRHWQSRRDAEDIAWLVLDKRDVSSNTLSRAVLEQLDEELTALEQTPPKGLVIASGKPGAFIMGADVSEFGALEHAGQAAALAAHGQQLLARLEALPCPSVAAIDGYALGGGLELALACDYRVAVEGYERNLGLPEVQLGIHPGFGGTVRLVELLGPIAALDLILSGRSVSPVEARRSGLVDRTTSAAELESVARELVLTAPRRRHAAWYLQLLRWPLLRHVLAWQLRARVSRRVRRSHYPAPFAIVALWARHGCKGPRAYQAEAESIGKLLVTPTCKNLVRMFMLRERLRNLAPKSAAVQHVHVVGGGIMGGDIASWCALKGLQVTLQDRGEEYLQAALERADKLFARRLRAPGAAAEARARLRVDIAGDGGAVAEVVLEAIVEKLEIKRELFSQLEPKLKADAVLATNTSSIRLEELAADLERPERLVGLHFFNPVPQLPLVEVIRGQATNDETLNRAMAFTVQIGKLPLPCRSSPGFVVNRVLTPYMLEALRAHEDGASLESIDAAAKAFGMPMGPIELADRVGLDIALSVAEILAEVLRSEPPRLLVEKVARGELGAKTGQGFYRYVDGRAQKGQTEAAAAELEDRLMLPLLNEAVACLHEGVVDDADLLDAGVVFGTGFAPFTGGPMHYARARGYQAVVDALERLAAQHGARFAPHAGWQRLIHDS